MNRSILWVFLFLMIGFVAFQYFRQFPGDQETEVLQEPPPAERRSITAIRHPVPDPAESREPLPAVDESDPALEESFSGLFGGREFRKTVLLDHLVRRIVVTVDNLPRKELPRKYLPVRPPEGLFLASGEGEGLTFSAENQRRYTPYVQLMETVETPPLVSLYVRFYPLFQQAYEDLGYPSGYFNDRLVQVIDHLLATPDVQGSVRLVQPTMIYRYADPELEKLSAGQKLLLRAGPENAGRIKEKLKEIRRELVRISLG